MQADVPLETGALLVILGIGAFLLVTSGVVVRTVINSVEGRTEPSQRELDVGAIVGKAENLLVCSLVLVDAFTALALIFAAKSIVRREDMKNDSLYYLAGTLVNFTCSLLLGVLAGSFSRCCSPSPGGRTARPAPAQSGRVRNRARSSR